jgi:hypothetical protein
MMGRIKTEEDILESGCVGDEGSKTSNKGQDVWKTLEDVCAGSMETRGVWKKDYWQV